MRKWFWMARFQCCWIALTGFFYPWRSLASCYECASDGRDGALESARSELGYWNEG